QNWRFWVLINIFKKKLIWVVLYLIFITVNILRAYSPLPAFFSWLRVTEFLILGLIFIRNTRDVYFSLQRIISFVVIFEFFLGLTQTLRQSSLGGLFWLLGERTFNIFTPGIARGLWLGKITLRPYGTFSHPNSLAGFILISLIFILGKAKHTWLDKLALLAGFVLILLSFSRTVWLALVALGLGVLLFKLKKKLLTFSFDSLFLLLAVPLGAYSFSKTTLDSASYLVRVDLAKFALNIIKGSPLFGVGLNNFVVSLAKDYQYNSQGIYWLQPVHNIFLLMGSEIGLIGLSIAIIFLFLLVKKLLSCYNCCPVKKNSQITSYQDNNLTIKPLVLLFALFSILFTGFFDHYWLTLIQNQLLLVTVLSLAYGQGSDKIG
ncbi:MAG: O-antigen ligase family protein, partial [Patescibacteria group bacterium]|nr:O-antigen ligase family protein [Patescibacteria group bacterium]